MKKWLNKCLYGVSDFLNKYVVEILVICLCGISMNALWTGGYPISYYFVGYETGFGGRKLVGSLMQIVFGQHYGYSKVMFCHRLFNYLAIYLFARVIGITTRRVREQTDNNVLLYFVYLVLLYLASPYTFRMYREGSMMPYIDVLLVDYVLVTLLCFLRCPQSWLFYLVAIVTSVAGILTHSGFANMYFPIVVALIVYNIFSTRLDVKNAVLNCLVILLPFVTFVAVTFFSTMNMTLTELISNLSERTDVNFSTKALYFEYYATLQDHWHYYAEPMLKFNIVRFIFTTLAMSPFYVLLMSPVYLSIRLSETKKQRWMYCLLLLTPALCLPIFFIAVDYGRWYQGLTATMFLLNVAMLATKDSIYLKSVSMVAEWAIKHRGLMMLLMLYFVCLGASGDTHTIKIVDKFIRKVFRLGWNSLEWSM